MFIDEKTLFEQAAAEREAQSKYENSCARTYSFSYEVPKLNIRRTCNIVAGSEQKAQAILFKQLPKEWLVAGLNITQLESRQRVDLIDPTLFDEYKKRIIEEVKPKKR